MQYRADQGVARMQPPVTLDDLAAAQSFFIPPTLISTISEISCDSPMK